MKLADNIYTDIEKDKVFRKKMDIVAKGGKSMPFYLVTLPLFSHGILEIYEYNELKQPYYKTRENDIVVLGISMSRTARRSWS
jgi:hypothetical protein